MDFYFNTSMDYTYAEKYYTLVCFHLQHDESYITLNKIRHLLVNHCVKDDVQSFNVALHIKMQIQKLLPSLQQILSFEPNTKMTIVFLITFIII
jgi:hypothetical protein